MLKNLFRPAFFVLVIAVLVLLFYKRNRHKQNIAVPIADSRSAQIEKEPSMIGNQPKSENK